MGTVSELLCLATMAKVWGWKDLLAWSNSPFWLLIPLPEIPLCTSRHEGKEEGGAKGWCELLGGLTLGRVSSRGLSP